MEYPSRVGAGALDRYLPPYLSPQQNKFIGVRNYNEYRGGLREGIQHYWARQKLAVMKQADESSINKAAKANGVTPGMLSRWKAQRVALLIASDMGNCTVPGFSNKYWYCITNK